MLSQIQRNSNEQRKANGAENMGFSSLNDGQQYRFTNIERMTVDEWIAVPDNPRQRDTERHARNARKRHLAAYDPKHARVDMARLPDGTVFKIDGHTRAHLWNTGELERPEFLYVDVWNCDGIAAVKALYTRYDNEGATERTPDKIYGALREHCVQFESPLMRSQRFGGAMRQAYEMMFGQPEARTVATHDLVHYWMPELQLLDACYPTNDRFPAPVVSGALVTLRRRGTRLMSFWRAYAEDAGVKNGGEIDAVQALDRRVQVLRTQRNLGGRHAHQEMVGVAISATEAWLAGRTYSVSTGIKQSQHKAVRSYMNRARTVVRSW